MSRGPEVPRPRPGDEQSFVAHGAQASQMSPFELESGPLPSCTVDSAKLTQLVSDPALSSHGLSVCTLLRMLNRGDFVAIGPMKFAAQLACEIVDSVPEVRANYKQARSAASFVASLKSLASLGQTPTPAQQFKREVAETTEQLLSALIDEGFIATSTAKRFMVLSHAASGRGILQVIPDTGTRISITRLGAAALEQLESAALQTLNRT